MKIIDFEIEIPKGKTSIEIVIVGDVHRGNSFFDEELWKLYYEGTKGHEGFKTDKLTYVLCIGDLMETALKDSLGVQDQSEWIEDQYLWTKDWLKPVQEDGRLIALLEGNHEKRATRNWLRTTRLLSKELDVPYAEGLMIINILLRKGEKIRKYKLCAAHGAGSSRTVGGKVNSIMRMQKIVADADIYVMGHLHDRIAMSVPIYLNDVMTEKLFGMTGAFLEYGGYAEEKLYSPPARGSLKLKLHFDIDRVSAR